MKIAVVGATGMVGTEMLKVLDEYQVEVSELIPVASERSVGKMVEYRGKQYPIVALQTAVDMKPQIAIFSAGGATSLDWAPKFAEVGCTVVDNSSAWRMNPNNKLIVPEINGDLLTKEDKIIANPNCSTIQLVMCLAPLHKKYGVKRVIVSTYQSVSGTGKAAIDQMNGERAGENVEKVYPYDIDMNCLPHCDVFQDNGYTKEEMKLTQETKKIVDEKINVSATAVRVPVSGGHSEAVNIEFENEPDLNEIRKILHETEGVVVQDNPDTNTYPMPKYAKGKNEVFVGRIREDFTNPNTVNMWIVADNLRKGAATNAVQIAKYLIANNLV
jgi:aspartate-semialdehyde dehydrogenase